MPMMYLIICQKTGRRRPVTVDVFPVSIARTIAVSSAIQPIMMAADLLSGVSREIPSNKG
ncbi:MAG: hypothetical protein HY220_03410 [Candidatus Sungbacteria bacterium]|uniref:Uncharacterized protein n=1 Tax=Candidatus Sungiibacteriota bacterium TaxID=2750080 RepID=A0A9D6QYU5_9BACT|nr:hypothetical protein [Candidatus Sungbacteria bacterium]